MTTVAMDGEGWIAWDSQITANGAVLPYNIEKAWLADGKLYAFAGVIADMDKAIEWHRKGARKSRAPAGNWALLVVTPRGAWAYSDDAPYKANVTGYFAMGSGEAYALGAMAHGASAYQAVHIASRFDTGTGGNVNVLHRSEIK